MATSQRILIWDLPTRAFHWLLVASFIGAWLTFDDNRYLDIHVYVGYVWFGLLVFRLIWGAIGGHYSRFHAFAHDWRSVWHYLKGLLNGEAARHLGHNPAGSWAIFALLVAGLLVSVTGVLTLGGEERHGPLAAWIPFQVGFNAHILHLILAWLLLGVVGAHLLGIIIESVLHRDNLIAAMITGYKAGPHGSRGVDQRGVVAIIMLAMVFAGALVMFSGYLEQTPERPYIPFEGQVLADNARWRTECGDCHLAFHPSLLPARSWQALMAGQDDHFGDDLGLDADSRAEILTFLVSNASENHQSEAAWMMDRSVAIDQAPLRVTEVAFWKRKHGKISPEVWKSNKVKSKANCAACHLDADKGTFEDAGMRIPKLNGPPPIGG